MTQNNPKISIVIPAFNESQNIKELARKIDDTLRALAMPTELIVIDDGSKDETWKEITALKLSCGVVRGIRFSKNFGHQYALYAGLKKSTGDAVITMDADLQHPPQVIKELVRKWKEGAKIVYALREPSKKESFFKRISSNLFYKMMQWFSGVDIPQGSSDFRLLDRDIVNKLLEFPENRLFMRGLIPWCGYPAQTVTYQCEKRYAGKSKYSLIKMMAFGLDGLTSFSVIPLRLIGIAGILMCAFSLAYALYALYIKLFTAQAVSGWTSLVLAILFVGGAQLFFLGIIAEYIGHLFSEIKQRPRFIIIDEVTS